MSDNQQEYSFHLQVNGLGVPATFSANTEEEALQELYQYLKEYHPLILASLLKPSGVSVSLVLNEEERYNVKADKKAATITCVSEDPATAP